jgi:hypothetical protein
MRVRRRFARHRLWWTALLFPCLLLRALIPVGFMPAVGATGAVRMAICRGYEPAARPTQPAAVAPAEGHRTPDRHGQGICPFGASPAHAALPAPGNSLIPVPRPAGPAIPTPTDDFFSVPFRAQAPRGPPA